MVRGGGKASACVTATYVGNTTYVSCPTYVIMLYHICNKYHFCNNNMIFVSSILKAKSEFCHFCPGKGPSLQFNQHVSLDVYTLELNLNKIDGKTKKKLHYVVCYTCGRKVLCGTHCNCCYICGRIIITYVVKY